MFKSKHILVALADSAAKSSPAVARAQERRAKNDELNRSRIQGTPSRPQLRRPIPVPPAR